MSHYPESWKEASIAILRKPERETYFVCKAYIPVSLLPVVGKVLERVVLRRLTYETDELSVLNSAQFGFRENHSAPDAILNPES